MTDEKIIYYCGQPINEMTREQLIDALENMAALYKEALDFQKKLLDLKYRIYFRL